MCARCGATSAVHTTERDYIVLLYVVAGLVVVLGVLWLAGITGTYSRLLCVTAYLAACAPFLRVASLFFPPVMTVTLTALPAPEREKETRDQRRARWDRAAAIEISKLGPEFERYVEPVPLEQELAEEADRIDAAHAAAPPPTSAQPEYERAEAEELESAKVTCVSCGELNQRDFGRCWNCEAVL